METYGKLLQKIKACEEMILKELDTQAEDEKLLEDTEVLLQKMKDCEEMILKKEAYQTLLDAIIVCLKLHFSVHSEKHKELISKIKEEMPHVYAFVKPHFKQMD